MPPGTLESSSSALNGHDTATEEDGLLHPYQIREGPLWTRIGCLGPEKMLKSCTSLDYPR